MGKQSRRRNNNKRNSKRGSNNSYNEETNEAMANFDDLALVDTSDVDETWQPYFHEETVMNDKLIKEVNVIALMRHHLEEIVANHGFVDEQGVTWFPLLAPSTTTGTNSGKQQNRCLGVPSCTIPGFVNLVGKDENSQYAKLPRPMVITPKTSCPIQLPDHPVEEGLMIKFWTGDFSVTFHNPCGNRDENHNCVDEDFFFCLQATATFADDDGTDSYACFCLQVKRGSSSLVLSNQNRLSGVKGTFTANLFGRLTEQQQELIGGRIVHHFLRCHGWMVPASGLFNMVEYSKARFQGKKKYTLENLDICIVFADIMVNRFYSIATPYLIGVAICNVADALRTTTKDVREKKSESSHHFREAFILYVEVAQRFMRNTQDEAKMYTAAGLNAYRCGLYTVTLNYAVYPLHLWAKGSAWDLSEENTNSSLCNLIIIQKEIDDPPEFCIFYIASAASASRKLGTTVLSRGLIDLLQCAKFRPNREGMVDFEESTNAPGTLLKPRYRNSPQAQRTLRRLFKSSRTVKEYQDNLLALLKDDAIQFARKHWPPRKIEQVGHVSEEILASRFKNDQKNDREFAKQQRPVILQHCIACGKPEESPKMHKACSRCHMALYCSANCQENDWKRHKVDCKKFAREYEKKTY